MRNRSWRRNIEESKVHRRLKQFNSRHRFWRRWKDPNGIIIPNPTWIDFIGSRDHYMFKTYVTSKYDSRHKKKWGKKCKGYDREGIKTRLSDKKYFNKLLNEHGLKHYNSK